MPKITSITLGEHFDKFITRPITEGRYASTSEVVWVALRLLEDDQQKTARLRKLPEEDQCSGNSEYSYPALMSELHDQLG
jgi:antitoxin ParD1/3/4